MKIKVFLDANVFFAGAGSPQGGSGFILELAKKNQIEIITVRHALHEAERNIQKKLGASYLLRHYQNLLGLKLSIQPLPLLTARETKRFRDIIPAKDTPILLGAISSPANVLITLDRKHFLKNEKLNKLKVSFEIMNPGEFLNRYF